MISDKKCPTEKQKVENYNSLIEFSDTKSILKDLKSKNTLDIVRIISKIDSKPFCFDFGSGVILVYRYEIEAIDSKMLLYVPAIKSFLNKVQISKYFEIHSKRSFLNNNEEEGTKEWIIYVNRIKNITLHNLNIKERMIWKTRNKKNEITFTAKDKYMIKNLPIENNLENTEKFLESTNDINRDSLLSRPLKILRIDIEEQLEFREQNGAVIKNIEYSALLHNNKIIKLYVPYFLKDIISNLIEKLLTMNIILSRLKLFSRDEYIGLLWDCTLSGFTFVEKTYKEKLMTLADGVEFFFGEEANEFIRFIWKTKKVYKNINRYRWKHKWDYEKSNHNFNFPKNTIKKESEKRYMEDKINQK